MGANEYGKYKVDALDEFIGSQYPNTKIQSFAARVGQSQYTALEGGDGASVSLTDSILDGADLVIDLSAEVEVTNFLHHQCRQRMIPLITAHATPTLQGGAVAYFDVAPGSACYHCLLKQWRSGEIPQPMGMNADESDMVQPPGCADLTFIGAGFDVQELSLNVCRVATSVISDYGRKIQGSFVDILSLSNNEGEKIAPTWITHKIESCDTCACQTTK